MKFSCEKALLQSAISIASRTVSPKSTISALEGILIEATSRLKLTGYNLETGITTELAAEISEMGSVVLSSRLFGEIVRKLPDDMVTISVDEKLLVNIRCGVATFNIMGISADDFPEIPEVDRKNTVSLSRQSLRSMISQTIFSVSENESRPVHTGCLFDVEESLLTVVAVDGFRLALRKEPVENESKTGFSFVVPGAALKEVEKICGDSEDSVKITLGSRHILFEIGESTLVCRLLEGDFLDYKKAVPRQNEIVLSVSGRALCDSVDRVSLIISEKFKSPVRCNFDDGVVTLTSNTAMGNAYDQCTISGDGKGLEIGFNNRYLLEALKAAPEDKLKIELNTSVSPAVIVPEEGEENFLYMVLPVRLKANES